MLSLVEVSKEEGGVIWEVKRWGTVGLKWNISLVWGYRKAWLIIISDI